VPLIGIDIDIHSVARWYWHWAFMASKLLLVVVQAARQATVVRNGGNQSIVTVDT
jgi:hypothetical protein